MQLFSGIRLFKNEKGKYRIVDYLKRNKIEGDIMYTSAKKLDSKVNIPTEIGNDLEENINFDKNTICFYKTKTDYEKSMITDTFNRGLVVEDKDKFFIKNGCHSLWKLFESIANIDKEEIAFLVKAPIKETNEMFGEIDGKLRVLPQYVYGALSMQNGKIDLVKNGTPQISEIIEKQAR